MKKFLTILFSSALALAVISGCSADDNKAQNDDNQELGAGENDGGAAGTMPAGEQSPLVSGKVEAVAGDSVTINVNGESTTFTLSEDAKAQVEAGKVSVGDSVQFHTFSIGSSTLTVDSFLNVE
ncbi:hypothetical protein CIB95_02915 [Lottiidibacillus patelloidae]|uniref:DUF5666 domain-containing protein n=1 Tax=Lottiidibacillus patelloidae TaxID=2670334 RepID=A0A263BXT9_9BACI|nr:hypothetical protein [Lottiidibacillus patelloidae]OZM58535.1 hypothetical protein CIB95_02915 [Lottiidibacillus patelloidae]